MSKMYILLIAALLATTPLIGCLGSEDLDEQDLPGQGDLLDQGTGAQVYRAGSAGQSATSVDPGSALPSGIPLPDGLSHLTEQPVFEPTIGVTSDGTLFMSNLGPGGMPTELSTIIRSSSRMRDSGSASSVRSLWTWKGSIRISRTVIFGSSDE